VAWLVSEVEEWIDKKLAERDANVAKEASF
jgi:predicted DNA-binding transcriptional regulator AlpA